MRAHVAIILLASLALAGCDKINPSPESVIQTACMANANGSTYGCKCLVDKLAEDQALKEALAAALRQCGTEKASCSAAMKRELGAAGMIQVGVAAKSCGVSI